MKDFNIEDQGQEDLEDMNTDENIAGATRLDDMTARGRVRTPER